MRKTIATLMSLGVLTSCGGDGTSAPGAPTITLGMASTAESGEIIPISVTVTDDKDSGLEFSLSCAGGTLTGTMLTLPQITADTEVECTATATDSDGKTGTAKKVITVKPATASLNAYGGAEQTVAAGGVGILFAENLPLEQGEYQGTFNGQSIPLYRVNGNELMYVLPVNATAGTGNLTVQIGSRMVSTPITVGAAIGVTNPRGHVSAFLQSARQEVEAAMAAPGISSQNRERLEASLPQLNQALATLPNASDAEVSELASRLAALGLLSAGTLRTAAYEPIVTGPDCAANAVRFATSLGMLVLGGTLVVEGTSSAIGGAVVPGAGWAAAVGSGVAIGFGVILVTKYGREIDPARRAFWTSCWTETNINLVPVNPDDFISAKQVAAITLPGKQSFRPEKAQNFKLERTFAPTESVRARANQYLSDIGKLLATVSILPDSVREALQAYKVDGAEPVPAGRVTLSNISSSKVSGTASANGDVITLTFDTSAKAEDLTDGKLPFSFNLLRSGEETVIVNAEMTLALPEAFDAAVEVTQGEATTSSVQTTGAETLHVTEAPAHGSVTLSDNGQFLYTPSGMYFGPDQFKYIARNDDGDSKEATVLVNVVRKFEGTWLISTTTSTTSESSPGICPPEQNTFTVSVSKISDTQYSTVYDGYELILSMGSKDSPNGPTGSKSYTEDEDGEHETGTVVVAIPDSQNLRGTGAWSWTSDEGMSCSGTTTITGRR